MLCQVLFNWAVTGMVVVHKYNQHLVYAIDANLCETSTTHQHYIASLDIQFMTTYPGEDRKVETKWPSP